MFDAALYYADTGTARSQILARHNLTPGKFILSTLHRAENTDSALRLRGIIDALVDLSNTMPVVLPLHPRTRAALGRESLLATANERLTIIDPVGYLEMIMLEQHASLVVTDSGGVQKEAFFFRTPCITLRDETEWVELVEHVFNQLVGADRERIVQAVKNPTKIEHPWDINLYGKGAAAPDIVRLLTN